MRVVAFLSTTGNNSACSYSLWGLRYRDSCFSRNDSIDNLPPLNLYILSCSAKTRLPSANAYAPVNGDIPAVNSSHRVDRNFQLAVAPGKNPFLSGDDAARRSRTFSDHHMTIDRHIFRDNELECIACLCELGRHWLVDTQSNRRLGLDLQPRTRDNELARHRSSYPFGDTRLPELRYVIWG